MNLFTGAQNCKYSTLLLPAYCVARRIDTRARYLIRTSRVSIVSDELHIAEFCLQYLNFGCFDADLTDAEIREFLQQGYYSFEDYAVAHWLDHVDSSTSQPLPPETTSFERLLQRLQPFLDKHGPKSLPELSVSTEQRFKGIRHWAFTKQLDAIADLARQRQTNEKYLNLETQLQRRRSIYEDIFTHKDRHSEPDGCLEFLNRSRLFKCPKIWCEFFFDGFQDREHRDTHTKQHERPFRCSNEECLRAEMGYGTEKELKRHVKTSHPTGQSSEWNFPTRKPKKEPDIFSACRTGDLATVQRLAEEGADVNNPSKPKGMITPLLLAVRYNHHDVVGYLLGEGCTAHHHLRFPGMAMPFATIPTFQMLIDAEANPKLRTEYAQDLLLGAAQVGRGDMVPFLLTYGVSINHLYSSRFTVLQIARDRDLTEFVQTLLDHGAREEVPQPKQPPLDVRSPII